MPDEKAVDPWAEAKRKGVYRKDGGTAPAVSAETKEKHGTTAGKDLGSKGKTGAGMPKQGEPGHEGEDMAAFSARMRKWREAGQSEQVQGQKKAIKGMQK